MVTVEIPNDYGYVVLVAVASFVVNMWLSLRVVSARKTYGVKYPALYAPDNNIFNCIQRSHQNFLEYYPFFIVYLLLGGLAYPKVGALGGVVYLLGRIAYAVGYSSGDPKKRYRGVFQYIGLYGLVGCTVKLGLNLLQWV